MAVLCILSFTLIEIGFRYLIGTAARMPAILQAIDIFVELIKD